MADTPFQGLVRTRQLTIAEAHRFQKFLHSAGGSVADTDAKTLATLFDIWKEKGRP